MIKEVKEMKEAMLSKNAIKLPSVLENKREI